MKHTYIKICHTAKKVFREDLQLHLLWSFFFSMFGIVWYPLILSGLVATIIKEGCDLWIKGHWSWDDFVFGVLGNIIAIILIVMI